MLDQGHNHLLVIASLAIALMAGFTGLSLTRGASAMPRAQRKLIVSMSAVVLGSGIWSMHFVAMLGLKLPVQFYYDALVTLISALVAILMTGIALLIVHFGPRTRQRIVLAGAVLGLGVPAMHYIGMSGMEVAKPVYTPIGIAIALICSLALCIASFWISYGERKARNILYGTAGFGLSVVAVHFIAMHGTEFVEVQSEDHRTFWISNEVLAFGVTLSSFVISGAFLLMGVTFGSPETVEAEPAVPVAMDPAIARRETPAQQGRIPYEKDSKIHFVPESEVAAVRAEGHYTFLYHPSGRLFCPWSISEVEQRVADNPDFIRCHRSYLVNTRQVTSFERRKDNGVCFFENLPTLDKVPVSRSYLKAIRGKLGL